MNIRAIRGRAAAAVLLLMLAVTAGQPAARADDHGDDKSPAASHGTGAEKKADILEFRTDLGIFTLVVFGILFLIQRQLGFGYVNPFDGRHIDDPLMFWFHGFGVYDPVKVYFGNVPGPIGVTSAPIRESRKVRVASRSRSWPTRYQRPFSVTTPHGSTVRVV